MKPFAILVERYNGWEIKEFLESTTPITGVSVPRFHFDIYANAEYPYIFYWNGHHYGFDMHPYTEKDIPRYRLEDLKYIFQLEKILK